VVSRIDQQEAPVLQYLASLGLILEETVTLQSIAPFGGVVTVCVGRGSTGAVHALGGDLAKHILIAPISDDAGDARR
jgi:hypothetical protein